VIDLQPLNKDAVIRMSALHEKSGEVAKAVEIMKEATVAFHDNVVVLLRAAEIALLAGSLEYAKSYLYRIIKLEPKHEQASRLLGDIFAKEGSKDKAWKNTWLSSTI